MRCYKITSGAIARYAGTKKEARNMRDFLAREFSFNARQDFQITEVDLPTKKDEYLAFVNELLSGQSDV